MKLTQTLSTQAAFLMIPAFAVVPSFAAEPAVTLEAPFVSTAQEDEFCAPPPVRALVAYGQGAIGGVRAPETFSALARCNLEDQECDALDNYHYIDKDEPIYVYEGQTLSFDYCGWWEPCDPPEPICVWADSLPPGAAFPTNSGWCEICSKFVWTPTCDQAGSYQAVLSGGRTCWESLTTMIADIIVIDACGDCPPSEILDCNGNCAPAAWLGDASCDDGAESWNGIPIYLNCPLWNCDEGDCVGCSCANFTVTAPGIWTGSSCAGNDCSLETSEEVMYEVTIPYDATWMFSLCGSSFDTYLYLGTDCCTGDVGSNDDDCGLQSELTKDLTAGTYYVAVEAYSDCGTYTLTIDDCVCGDGVCECGEDCSTCPQDCSPSIPENPTPPDEATEVPLDTNLCWNGGARITRVIYGTDDRLDVYQVLDPAILAAADATVALVSDSILTDNHNGTYTLPDRSFTDKISDNYGYPLCASEPFRDQPAPASCSGFLVGADLIVTAGHCIYDAGDCAAKSFVFGFQMLNATTPVLTLPASDVYHCDSIVDRVYTAAADWAVIQLDRPVVGHVPLSIRRTGTIPNGQSLLLIGHPVGLPTKIAGGATVRDNGPSTHFQANLDAYGGNSGSAVFDATTLAVEGVLVRGNLDFERDGNCIVSIQCPDSGCSDWEDATRTTEFAHLVPQLQIDEYDVYFGPCGNMQFRETTTSTCWSPPALSWNATYCWRIVAKGDCDDVEGPVWSFTTSACPDGTATMAFVADGMIDAGQPHAIDGTVRAGYQTFVAMNGPAGANDLSCWTLTETDIPNETGDCGNSVTGVLETPAGSGDYVITLAHKLQPGAVTALTYTPDTDGPVTGTYTALPGDVDGSGETNIGDLGALIACLNAGTCELWECDVDRLESCTGADLERLVDLLSGAGTYKIWDGETPAAGLCP